MSSLSPLVARDVSKSYADRVVLDGVDLTASPGQVLAVVGENGSGKSTLLRLLAGAEELDGGTVLRPDDLGYLGQELVAPPTTTVRAFLDDALAPLHAAVARLERLAERLEDDSVAQEYAELLDWAVHHDAWDASRRAGEAAARLGLDRLPPERPFASLSGGQRSRLALALAALLTRRPDCLVLDEPTNHLDDQALDYLEGVLRALPGVAVVTSHDRVFLDNVAAAVLDLDAGHLGSDGNGGRLRGMGEGGYSALLADRTAARRRWEETFSAQQEELARLRRTVSTTARQVAPNRGPRDNDKFIHHFKGANVERTVARRVRDTERRMALLQDEAVPKPPAPLRFHAVVAPGAGAAVHLRDLRVPGRLRLARLDVHPGERLLVTGGNGSGKSTRLTVLAGRLAPGAAERTTGEVRVHARRIGYLAQDTRFPRPEASAAAVYATVTRNGGGKTPALHDLGLLHPRELHRPVGELSVGQQRRLALAVLVAGAPDLVLLDEPTNHISLALAEELEEALLRSPGTVVVASHDRWLRRRWDAGVLAL